MKHNYWGVAIDFGFPITSFLDLKLVEGGLTFHNAEVKETEFNNDVIIFETTIESNNVDMGYYVGSGLIIHLIKDYVSIEGTVAYNLYKIKEFKDSNGNAIILNEFDTFIENKGITTTVQINIGFPL